MSSEKKLLYKVPHKPWQLQEEVHKKYISEPRLLGFYTNDYGYYSPVKSIKYLKLPMDKEYPLDLNAGCEGHIYRKPFMCALKLYFLLKWVMSPKGLEFRNECCDKTVVYTRRGILTKLMSCPLLLPREYNNITFDVSRYNGDLYICELEQINYDVNDERPKVLSHHRTLAEILFTDWPDGCTESRKCIDDNIRDILLYRAALNKYELIYLGEASGILSDEKIEDLNDIDKLNECTFVHSKQIWDDISPGRKFEKNIAYWVAAYLAKVKYIYTAEKTGDGKVYNRIQQCEVSRMPMENKFNPGFLIGFFYKLLNMIETVMADVNSLETVYEFQFDGVSKEITYCVYSGLTEKTFIDDHYIWRNSNCS